ncbi:MAG: A/G-specific adenine glycosylase [Actinobacteria bacterium]|nr:A/G-specific adenine glycosylase [Actinomycetota bacterium]NIS29483.1 A/G-specific adenine glycosylase [Actinomycetota bacterium]NIT94549.1 A/G-specific adenine glycosylase [Actinomycetota bacterium]NIU18159.1 A/G-specific adenine glycosylase [Actinomycetota bacterium]NIU64833.1 A/G-specific adenine glycosylase [Actinomycetota bacterium]
MLQQTQVARVVDRWASFLDEFPDPATCAAAGPAAVVRAWSGLGYNRRATMLHGAAETIVARHGGRVPSELDALLALLALPGVGPYTARAVRAFAFEERAAPVDTNIGRVLARVDGVRLSPAEAQRTADHLVGALPDGSTWRWNQALMELGATVCTTRRPDCGRCPLGRACSWHGGDGPGPTADPAVGSAAAVDTLGPRESRVLDGLVDDGLVAVEDGVVRLVGDPLSPAP